MNANVATPLPVNHVAAGTAAGGLLIILLVVALAYLLPSVIAFLKKHPRRWAIFMTNVFFGWTVIGYLFALKWALGAPRIDSVPMAAPVLIQEALAPANPLFSVPVTPAAISAPRMEKDSIEQLEKLGALFEKGLLTADEFQKAKAKILG